MKAYPALAAAAFGLIASAPGQPPPLPGYLAQYQATYAISPHEAALRWFAGAKYGLMVHYTLASLLNAGDVGYAARKAKDPGLDQELFKRFTASKFDANRIADLARAAGMAYVTFTSEHLGGMAMWNTSLSDFSSVHAPARRDLVAELAAACARRRLGLFLYVPPDTIRTDGAFFGRNQRILTELLTHYGPIAGIWFDGVAALRQHPEHYARIQELFALVRRLQPQCLVSWKTYAQGTDFLAPEHTVGPLVEQYPDRPVEVCTTLQMCRRRDLRTDDHGWISNFAAPHLTPDAVILMIRELQLEGAQNVLLNTGLEGDGSIAPADERTLRAVGEYMRAHWSATPAAPEPEPVLAIQQRETPAERNARMAWWRNARFGLFIHWGLYAEPAGVWKGRAVPGIGEWIMNHARIPVAQYQALAARFDPTRFDADAWVSLAKDAGVRYIVITAKHHDGFAMFRSAANPFNIYDATPFHRDPLKELATACLKQGIRLGFYYSQDQDWTAPGAAAIGGHWDPAQDGSFARYLETKAIPQIQELLSNYSPYPAVLWFDTPTKDMTPELAGRIVTVLNRYPGLIWNSRLGGGYSGDFQTPEQRIPGRGYPGQDWETCMTINDTWGYKRDDRNFKSTETLLRNLIDIASKGGNYLLNVGPDATGTIPGPEADRLRAMGRWLRINGEAIYGTGPTPFGPEAGSLDPSQRDKHGEPLFHPSWVWRCTTRPGRLYLIFFQWPREFTLPPLAARVTRAYLLADPAQAVGLAQTDGRVRLTLPARAPDPIASVVVLETSDDSGTPSARFGSN